MSAKVSDIRSSGVKEVAGAKRRRGGDEEDDAEFKKTLREVLEFVTPQLGKRERQQWEEQRVRALGGTIEKRPKTPYWLMQKQQKRQEAKRQQILAEEKTLGVSMSASAHRQASAVDKLLRKKKQAAKDKKSRREDRLYDIGLGAREKRGMAVIPQRSVNALKRGGAGALSALGGGGGRRGRGRGRGGRGRGGRR